MIVSEQSALNEVISYLRHRSLATFDRARIMKSALSFQMLSLRFVYIQPLLYHRVMARPLVPATVHSLQCSRTADNGGHPLSVLVGREVTASYHKKS
jgi:hypothetical protein